MVLLAMNTVEIYWENTFLGTITAQPGTSLMEALEIVRQKSKVGT